MIAAAIHEYPFYWCGKTLSDYRERPAPFHPARAAAASNMTAPIPTNAGEWLTWLRSRSTGLKRPPISETLPPTPAT
jgi:hypothetical protein